MLVLVHYLWASVIACPTSIKDSTVVYTSLLGNLKLIIDKVEITEFFLCMVRDSNHGPATTTSCNSNRTSVLQPFVLAFISSLQKAGRNQVTRVCPALQI